MWGKPAAPGLFSVDICLLFLTFFIKMYTMKVPKINWRYVQYMVDQMQEKIDEQDKGIQRLKTLLSQNGIDEEKTEK